MRALLAAFSLLLLALLAAAAPPCPISSPSTCDWYSCVSNYCQCTPSDYPEGYGYKFCSLYGERMSSFSAAGQQWINAVRTCLQVALLPSVTPSIPCSELTTIAFATHVGCYTSPGYGAQSVCFLPVSDWVEIMITIKSAFVTAFSETVSQMLSTLKDCGASWAAQLELNAESLVADVSNAVSALEVYASTVTGTPTNRLLAYSRPKASTAPAAGSSSAHRVRLFLTFLSEAGAATSAAQAVAAAIRARSHNFSSAFNGSEVALEADGVRVCQPLCDNASTKSGSSSLSPGAIGGIVVAGVFVALGLLAAVALLRRKRKAPEPTAPLLETELELDPDRPYVSL
jgi:hypothetical protein